MIHWMKEQGHGHADIARKTGLGEDYVKDILNMLRNGEERLLEAVLHGKIPVTIAVGISGATDDEAQRLLMEAYERKEMNQKSLTAFKRVLDQRRYFGRKYGPRHRDSARRTSAESLVRCLSPRIPAPETHGPKSQALRSETCPRRLRSRCSSETRTTSISSAQRKLETMPKFLAERGKQPE